MSKKLLRRTLSGAVASTAMIAGMGVSSIAWADIEEIIVTSQKREQSIQTIPISVTAFDAAALEAKQIDVASDLQFNTPNVNYTAGNFGGGGNFQIRGIGSAAVGASGDGGVGIHVNDAPLRSSALLSIEYFDIERLEVLRGPQGTLFGRNSTGGVLNVITAKPDLGEFHGELGASVGNFNHRRMTGMLNVPMGENFGVRLAGIMLERDGFTDNLYTGSDIDGRDQYSWRASARWTPGDRTTIDATYTYFEEDSNRARISKQLCHRDPTGILGCLPDRLAFETTNANSTLGSIVASAETMVAVSGTPAGAVLGWDSILNPSDSYNNAINPSNLREVSTDFEPEFYSEDTLWTAQLEHQFDNSTLTLLYSQKEANGESRTDYNWAVNNTLTNLDPYGVLGVPGTITSVSDILTHGTTTFLFPGIDVYAPLYAGGMVPISNLNDDDTGIVGGDYTLNDRPDGYDRSYGSSEQWTLEARLASDLDGDVNYLVGGFMMHTESQTGYNVVASSLDYASLMLGYFNVAPGFGLLSPYYHNQSPRNELDTWAVFGEVYFDLNENIRLTGGLRYNNDEKTYIGFQSLLAEGAAPLGGTGAITPGSIVDGNETWQEMTGRALIEWTPDLSWTDDTLIYGSYSRGYKGGGFNPGSFSGATAAAFDPEFVNAIEIGMKNTMMDNTLTANLTGFHYDYEGYQVSKIVDRTSLNENIDSKIWGLEAEFVYAPDEHWLTNVTFSYLHTEIQDAESVDGRDPTNGEAGYLLIKDLSNASNCVFDPGSMPLATAMAYLPGAALPLVQRQFRARLSWCTDNMRRT